LERTRETRPATMFGGVRGRSYSTEKVVIPVVMESEIQGLDDLNGYFTQRDKVVRISFTPRVKRVQAEGLIERVIPSVHPPDEDLDDDEPVSPRALDRVVKPWRGQVELYGG
jgi:hypothetical protein